MQIYKALNAASPHLFLLLILFFLCCFKFIIQSYSLFILFYSQLYEGFKLKCKCKKKKSPFLTVVSRFQEDSLCNIIQMFADQSISVLTKRHNILLSIGKNQD